MAQSSTGLGGAVYFDLSDILTGMLTINKITEFSENRANQGGAMYFSLTSGSLDINMEEVSFKNNYAKSKGHIIFA